MKVFITGASSGIGKALAQAYALRGATLGLVGRRRTALESLRENLDALCSDVAHTTHRVYDLDVTDHDTLRKAASDFMAQVGVPDIVIANAGVSIGTLTEYAEDLEAFRRIVDTNLLAVAATFQPFIAPMKNRPSARLVGIASVAGIRGLPGSEAYSASKAAVISYCESLRLELRETSIRVVTIAPGYVRTPMTAKNPYPMPFMMDAERFAMRAVATIERGTSYAVIPWPMAIVAKLLRILPNWLYDMLFAKAPRKPRA